MEVFLSFQRAKAVQTQVCRVLATGTVKKLSQGLVLWTQTHGHHDQGRPAITYADTLMHDTWLTVNEGQTAMEDRDVWKAIFSHQLQMT